MRLSEHAFCPWVSGGGPIVGLLPPGWPTRDLRSGKPGRGPERGLSQAGFGIICRGCALRPSAPAIRPATLDRIFPTCLLAAHRELDRAQPAAPQGPTNPPFRALSRPPADAALIDRGRARYDENRHRPRRSAGATRAAAISGRDLGQGDRLRHAHGQFDLLNSLASLAYEGRRRTLFTTEFIATLRLVERASRATN